MQTLDGEGACRLMTLEGEGKGKTLGILGRGQDISCGMKRARKEKESAVLRSTGYMEDDGRQNIMYTSLILFAL